MCILDQKQASELVSQVSHFKDIKNKEEEGEEMEEKKEEKKRTEGDISMRNIRSDQK